MAILADIFSSRTRAELFRVLFGLASGEHHLRELQRLTGGSLGAVQNEVANLTRLGLVTARRDGNRKYFTANRAHPLYPEIHAMVLKTCGLRDVLAEALADEGIRWAFVFGSLACGEEQPESDVDLMVVGSVGLRRLSVLLSGVSGRIGREVNPHAMSMSEFRDRLNRNEHLVSRVMAAPKLFIVGNEDDLAAMVQ
ncbi:MAG: toxin-antitoxin system toxin subunit [Kiritimatiellaeota bacterium]|nr:toxin-antitoxin system toxin subunit [Kiritimatiellota bacterium]